MAQIDAFFICTLYMGCNIKIPSNMPLCVSAPEAGVQTILKRPDMPRAHFGGFYP